MPTRAERGRHQPTRLASVKSLRYEYWRVGINAFLRRPVRASGSGGFRVRVAAERRDAEAPARGPLAACSRWPSSSGRRVVLFAGCSSGGVVAAAPARAPAGALRRTRGVRRLRRLAPARLDRLGLAAPGGHAARRGARRGAPRRGRGRAAGARAGDWSTLEPVAEPAPLASRGQPRLKRRARHVAARGAPGLTRCVVF